MGEASGAGPARWTQMEGEVRAWRAAHPTATLTEIEAAVDVRFQALRAELLGELATETPVTAEPCPHCGGPLIQRGTHTRSIVTQGDQPVPLTRAYATCPACGDGLFPP